MSDWKINEEQLNRVNTTLARADDVIVYNCITRTAQESKLFPLMPYMMLCFYDAYYRYPDLIREASAVMSPEAMGHRVREASMLPSKTAAWSTLNFYLNGRASLIRLGLLRPEDNLEDLVTVVDWWERFSRSFHRNNGHAWAYDQGDIAPELPEKTLQVLESDAWAADDALRKAASRFMGTATQYLFLANCESRITMQASGPYRLGDNLLLHTRDFMNLANCDYSWLDGVADDMPYNSLTLAVITRDTAIEVTDWSTAYTDPENYQDNIVGVGLYTSDWLTDTYQPVGMGSAKELTDTLKAITEEMNTATRRLYSRFADMNARQMTELGITTYVMQASGISHLAGTFRHDQWQKIDERTERMWAIHNEEYSLDAYLENFALLSGYQGSQSEYYLHPVSYEAWRKTPQRGALPTPGRSAFPIPATVLGDHDYSLRANSQGLDSVRGTSNLPTKTRGWRTSRGMMSEAELNQAAREFSSPMFTEPWVNYDEQWVKWNAADPSTDAMYKHVQQTSRHLKDAGSGLVRADLMALRSRAGEPTWADLGSNGSV